jgi:hypothetical protein
MRLHESSAGSQRSDARVDGRWVGAGRPSAGDRSRERGARRQFICCMPVPNSVCVSMAKQSRGVAWAWQDEALQERSGAEPVGHVREPQHLQSDPHAQPKPVCSCTLQAARVRRCSVVVARAFDGTSSRVSTCALAADLTACRATACSPRWQQVWLALPVLECDRRLQLRYSLLSTSAPVHATSQRRLAMVHSSSRSPLRREYPPGPPLPQRRRSHRRLSPRG